MSPVSLALMVPSRSCAFVPACPSPLIIRAWIFVEVMNRVSPEAIPAFTQYYCVVNNNSMVAVRERRLCHLLYLPGCFVYQTFKEDAD